MESSSNHMASLLKIESSTSGWVKSLRKLLNSINDVEYTIDKRSKTVYVYGKTNPEIILEKIAKAGQKADIVWTDYRGKGNQRDHFMEQCYPSGYINAPPPNGYLSYHHHQHSNFPPPQNWMYQQQFPPHYQTYALPPPYTRQLHPQPPLQPYGYHQNEPVAKSFPPTPAPPKNFTMGDLQPGCRIM